MQNKKHYIIYQITNLLNGKIYIGKHETTNIDDDYMGSGKLIKRAMKKYGIENFKKEILFDFETEAEMNSKEKEIVNEDFLLRGDVYNLMPGGSGGFSYAMEKWRALQTDEAYKKFFSDKQKERWIDPGYRSKISKIMSNVWSNPTHKSKVKTGLIKYYETHPGTFLGKHHSEESKNKISKKRIGKVDGDKNPSYGKHWFMNPFTGESHMFKSGDEPNGWVRGRV